MSQKVDVVIPLGPNDKENINKLLNKTKENILNINNIYLITYDKDIEIEDVIIIDEKIFPFTKDSMNKYNIPPHRRGWYLQQLIKLYVSFVIPELTDNYLVIDADTYFLKPITFINEEGLIYLDTGREYHKPYFEHMKRLHSSLIRYDEKLSGISHHMLFTKKYLKELFNLVEDYHYKETNQKKEFWELFLEKIKGKKNKKKSGASEYEIYFNFMNIYHPDKIINRKLFWRNRKIYNFNSKRHKLNFVSIHWYRLKKKK